ncbi:Trp biosynthesis-associated membrane protein [Glycomyces sp. L485]|uniref:Trp biosynthesis-associated membrane protein n=1 Tax=Glycomyces sp. L485 TaxID=2909235 RepID=UPI001F4A15D9|nr:Trp biosynthesis-associated membrane protein [Glycomyces sp. L485]MCH7230145.1 Trp biosynthesis-associated membrane protein [Glycomyces sp. L485]
MSAGSERARTLLVGLAAVGAAALAATREWASETVENAAGMETTASQTGTDLAAWALPCALAAGAAFLAMLAVGRRMRRVTGALAMLAGLAVALAGAFHLDKGAAPIGLAAAGLVVAAAGAAAMLRSGRWPEPEARYDSNPVDGDVVAEDPAKLWNALDSGQDPSSPKITATAQEKGRS